MSLNLSCSPTRMAGDPTAIHHVPDKFHVSAMQACDPGEWWSHGIRGRAGMKQDLKVKYW